MLLKSTDSVLTYFNNDLKKEYQIHPQSADLLSYIFNHKCLS